MPVPALAPPAAGAPGCPGSAPHSLGHMATVATLSPPPVPVARRWLAAWA